MIETASNGVGGGPITRACRSCFLAAVAGAVLWPACGCATTHEGLLAFIKAHEHEVSAADYTVGIGDVIGISAPRILEIDRSAQIIGPDGKINLRLLGPVKVAGMTEKEVSAKLKVLLDPYYDGPIVQVHVIEYRSKKYYVFGEVSSRGSGGGGAVSFGGGGFAYTGRDTVLDAIANAGLSFIAWRSQIKVIRADPDPSERHEIIVDIDQMVTTGDTRLNVLLEPGDIVFVPPTPLGWIGLRIQEVLFPFQPVIQAYTTPASVIASGEVYQNESD